MLSSICSVKNGRGFTLIEILIVIAIIGILAAIAIPQFSQYKERSYNSTSKADLNNLYLACKEYWANNTSSDDCTLASAALPAYGLIQSPDVTLAITNGKEDSFEATASHASSDTSYKIDSSGSIT